MDSGGKPIGSRKKRHRQAESRAGTTNRQAGSRQGSLNADNRQKGMQARIQVAGRAGGRRLAGK
jgi:hypothetical protein